MRFFRVLVLAALSLGLSACQPMQPRPQSGAAPVQVRLIAINDFHGYLEPSSNHEDGAVPGVADQLAGGAAALAGLVERLRAAQPNARMVAAGDLVGASPLSSSLLRDEPSIEVLSRMGLVVSAVGNHEFDHGLAEVQRLQNGGCPTTGCVAGKPEFAGATFRYLSANIFEAKTGKRVFPAYQVETIGAARVAFIGATLHTAPDVVVPMNIVGLRFDDEVASINALVPEIRAQGVRAMVVLIHEGGVVEGVLDAATCAGLRGPIVDLVRRLDPEIDVVVSAHSHRAYVCRVDGRLLSQGGSYGHLATAIDLEIDRASGDVLSSQAENFLADSARPSSDPAYASLVAAAKANAQAIATRPIARLAVAQIARAVASNGESPLGRLIADSQLEAARAQGAQIACMNAGGVRQNLPASPRAQGPLEFADLQAVQPFGNSLVVLDLSGSELLAMLEDQWRRPVPTSLLSCSHGFSYRFEQAHPLGQHIVAGSARLNGKPIGAQTRYRVAVNSFLGGGGDSNPTLKQAKRVADVGDDLEALITYLKAHEPVAPSNDIRAQGAFGGAP
ncbi:MAG: bifunctional metallophosphatase/5'-nucleotidase [Arenimonas sp.]